MRGAIPLLPQYVFMPWCLVKHRDTFTFMFYGLEDEMSCPKVPSSSPGHMTVLRTDPPPPLGASILLNFTGRRTATETDTMRCESNTGSYLEAWKHPLLCIK
jgi:hypothetical protein